jgi:hypothetical protein
VSTSAALQDLVAINLRYDAGAEALHIRAVAQLVAKVLFAAGRGVSRRVKDLAKEGAKVLGVKQIPTPLVESALGFLKSHRAAKDYRGRWMLTDEGYEAIDGDVQRAEKRLDGVLERHFPQRIDKTKLKSWFRDACTAFYGEYGTQWAASLGRRSGAAPITAATLTGILNATTKRFALQSENDSLIAGFHSFLASGQADDIEHNWSLCQAMLASRLVAANIGPDPITVRDFRDSTVLLDTNVLIVTALERHRLAKPLSELAKALNEIGAHLRYVHRTRDEYVGVLIHIKDQAMRLVSRFPMRVIREARDPFIDTALQRFCTSPEDFERFFGEVVDPPTSIDGTARIELFDDPEIAGFAEKGAADANLKQDIERVWNTLRPKRKKTTHAIEHDASVTAVAEALRKRGERCWILTLDRTMHEHSLKRVGPHEPPMWISLDALIQVLAVDSAGPNVDPADFAPLMATIIHHQCEPVLGTYTAEDLAVLLDVEDRCADLPEEKVKAIAVMVARNRLSGKQKDDPELQLEVRRAFQKAKLGLEEQLEASGAELRARGQQLERETRRRVSAETLFVTGRVKGLRERAVWGAVLRSLGLLGLAAVLSAGAFVATKSLVPEGYGATFVQTIATIGAPAIGALLLIFRSVIPRLRRDLREVEGKARQELSPPDAE